MSKPSKVSYPGHGKSTPDSDGLLWLSSISKSERLELVNLIKNGEDTLLKRAWLGKREHEVQHFEQYSGSELWCYNYFHSSFDDATEHATFRLFDDAETNPWNVRVYHLYRDGTTKAWTYEKWEAEGRPEAP